MKAMQFKTVLGVLAGFAAGLMVSNLPSATAAAYTVASAAPDDLTSKKFDVAIFEVKQKLIPGNFLGTEFSGTYTKTVTMSDGKQRQIELTPMMHKGMQVVRLKDSGHTSYMGLNSTTLNGTLLVQLRDKDAAKAALKAEGWAVQ